MLVFKVNFLLIYCLINFIFLLVLCLLWGVLYHAFVLKELFLILDELIALVAVEISHLVMLLEMTLLMYGLVTIRCKSL
jgi:hypothetical protein